MVLDLKQLFGSDNGAKQLNAEFDLSDIEFSGVFPIKAPVRITGEILSKTGIVSLSAEIKVEYKANCDRCGAPITKNFTFPVKRVLVTELSNAEDDSNDLLVLPDMKLDVSELVHCEVVLSIPTKLLCREDCRGVCQTCGKNLNEGKCNCNTKTVDPRLQVLQKLLEDE